MLLTLLLSSACYLSLQNVSLAVLPSVTLRVMALGACDVLKSPWHSPIDIDGRWYRSKLEEMYTVDDRSANLLPRWVLRCIRSIGYVVCMGEIRNAHRF
jgi:hypothetical protein